MPTASSSGDAGAKCSSTAFFRPGTDSSAARCSGKGVSSERVILLPAANHSSDRLVERVDLSRAPGRARRAGGHRELVRVLLVGGRRRCVGRPESGAGNFASKSFLTAVADQLLRDDLRALLLPLVDHLDLPGDGGKASRAGRRGAGRRFARR